MCIRDRDKPLEKCPKCGGAVVKLISSPAIQFKGNGWYVTDYAKKSSPAAETKAGSKTGSKAEPKAEPKTDSNGSAKTKSEKSEKSAS